MNSTVGDLTAYTHGDEESHRRQQALSNKVGDNQSDSMAQSVTNYSKNNTTELGAILHGKPPMYDAFSGKKSRKNKFQTNWADEQSRL